MDTYCAPMSQTSFHSPIALISQPDAAHPVARWTLGRFAFGPWAESGSVLALWWRRARTRAELSRLDEAGLADIALSEAERRAECARWFWQGADR